MPKISFSPEYSLEDMIYLLKSKKIKLGIARSKGQGEKAADLSMEVLKLEHAIERGEPCVHMTASFE